MLKFVVLVRDVNVQIRYHEEGQYSLGICFCLNMLVNGSLRPGIKFSVPSLVPVSLC